jgi:hypothetical protein
LEKKSEAAVLESVADAEERRLMFRGFGLWEKPVALSWLWALGLVLLDVFPDGNCGFHAVWVACKWVVGAGASPPLTGFDVDPACRERRSSLVFFLQEQLAISSEAVNDNLAAPTWLIDDNEFGPWQDNLVNGIGRESWVDQQTVVLAAWREGQQGIILYQNNSDADGASATVYVFGSDTREASQSTYENGVNCPSSYSRPHNPTAPFTNPNQCLQNVLGRSLRSSSPQLATRNFRRRLPLVRSKTSRSSGVHVGYIENTTYVGAM